MIVKSFGVFEQVFRKFQRCYLGIIFFYIILLVVVINRGISEKNGMIKFYGMFIFLIFWLVGRFFWRIVGDFFGWYFLLSKVDYVVFLFLVKISEQKETGIGIFFMVGRIFGTLVDWFSYSKCCLMNNFRWYDFFYFCWCGF